MHLDCILDCILVTKNRQRTTVQLVEFQGLRKEERFSASTRNVGATEFQWSGRNFMRMLQKVAFTEGKDPKEAVYIYLLSYRATRTAQQGLHQQNNYSTDISQ